MLPEEDCIWTTLVDDLPFLETELTKLLSPLNGPKKTE